MLTSPSTMAAYGPFTPIPFTALAPAVLPRLLARLLVGTLAPEDQASSDEKEFTTEAFVLPGT